MKRVETLIVLVTTLAAAVPPAGAEPLLDTNLLNNEGFESSSQGWTLAEGNFQRRSADPDPAEGGYYYYAGQCDQATIYQEFDLAALGFDASRLATGGYYATYGGRQGSKLKSEDVYYDVPILGLQLVGTVQWADEGTINLNQYAGGAANGSGGIGGHGELDGQRFRRRADCRRNDHSALSIRRPANPGP